MTKSMRRASFGDRYAATSNSFTSPAIWLESRDASKRVMRVTPGVPARALSQACRTVLPIGQTMPSPVTTTLRRVTQVPLRFRSRLGVRLDVVDGLLDGGDFLGFLVGNLGLELLLERHHQLDGVERVRAQVIDERRLVLDLGFVDSELLGDDLLDALFDVFHPRLLPVRGDAVRGSRGARILRHIHAAVDVQHCARDVAAAPPRDGRNPARSLVSLPSPQSASLMRSARLSGVIPALFPRIGMSPNPFWIVSTSGALGPGSLPFRPLRMGGPFAAPASLVA